MSKAFNRQVQILTITNPKSMPLIDGLKANIKADKTNYTTLTRDINTLIKWLVRSKRAKGHLVKPSRRKAETG